MVLDRLGRHGDACLEGSTRGRVPRRLVFRLSVDASTALQRLHANIELASGSSRLAGAVGRGDRFVLELHERRFRLARQRVAEQTQACQTMRPVVDGDVLDSGRGSLLYCRISNAAPSAAWASQLRTLGLIAFVMSSVFTLPGLASGVTWTVWLSKNLVAASAAATTFAVASWLLPSLYRARSHEADRLELVAVLERVFGPVRALPSVFEPYRR